MPMINQKETIAAEFLNNLSNLENCLSVFHPITIFIPTSSVNMNFFCVASCCWNDSEGTRTPKSNQNQKAFA